MVGTALLLFCLKHKCDSWICSSHIAIIRKKVNMLRKAKHNSEMSRVLDSISVSWTNSEIHLPL